MSLFAKLEPEDDTMASRPLAERMRPRTLEEFAGQQALLGPGKPLRVAIERDDLGSMILWVRRVAAKQPWRDSLPAERIPNSSPSARY